MCRSPAGPIGPRQAGEFDANLQRTSQADLKPGPPPAIPLMTWLSQKGDRGAADRSVGTWDRRFVACERHFVIADCRVIRDDRCLVRADAPEFKNGLSILGPSAAPSIRGGGFAGVLARPPVALSFPPSRFAGSTGRPQLPEIGSTAPTGYAQLTDTRLPRPTRQSLRRQARSIRERAPTPPRLRHAS